MNKIAEGIKIALLDILKTLGLNIVASSYWICLIICMVSILIYIAGQKKAAKYTTISLVVYIILEAFKVAYL